MASEWYIKREMGNRAVTMTAEQSEVQAFVEKEIRENPEHGGAIVYQRYATCRPVDVLPLGWAVGGLPPASE